MTLRSGLASRQARIPILTYHQTATPPPVGAPFRSLTLPPARFSQQLRALRLLGYRGLSMHDLEPYLWGEKKGKVVGITLDDGYLSNFEHALPILRDLGFTATCYVVSGELGGSNVWDHPVGIRPVPLMDASHLRAWVAAGMDVGAHTRHHVNLLACDAATARDEIAGSKRELEDALGCEVRHFCYPYGQHRLAHADMARQAGYVTATTVVHARVRPQDDLMLLPRISVFCETKIPLLLAQVATELEELRQLRRGVRPGDWTVRPVYAGELVEAGGSGPAVTS